MKALYKINPSLHNNLSCMKRVGVFTWILGWGVYSNARNIAKIKDNIHTLQKQNQLQDKQIKQLANFLNLTMHQVDKHSEMLYEIDTKMTQPDTEGSGFESQSVLKLFLPDKNCSRENYLFIIIISNLRNVIW